MSHIAEAYPIWTGNTLFFALLVFIFFGTCGLECDEKKRGELYVKMSKLYQLTSPGNKS
jgi:hypothetical protein